MIRRANSSLAIGSSILVTAALFLQPASNAQTYWEVVLPTNDKGSADYVVVLPDRSIVVAGSAALDDHAEASPWIARFDIDGGLVWQRDFRGPARGEANGLVLVDDGLYVLGFRYAGRGSADGQGFAAALTLSGEVGWETVISSEDGNSSPRRIRKLSDGDFLVSGSLWRREAPMESYAFLNRLAREGGMKWQYSAAPPEGYYEGSNSTLKKDFLGMIKVRETSGPIMERANGDIELQIYRYPGIPAAHAIPERCDVISSEGARRKDATCVVDESAHVPVIEGLVPFIAKPFPPNFVGARDIIISTRGVDGNEEQIYQFETPFNAGLTDAIETADGGLIGVGFLRNEHPDRLQAYDAVMFRIDAHGNEVWSLVCASDKRDTFTRIAEVGDEQYVAIGHTGKFTGTQRWDPWLLRFGPDGPNDQCPGT